MSLAPLFFGALVLCLVHPANITCLALFDNALDFEILQVGSSFSLTMLVGNVVWFTSGAIWFSGFFFSRPSVFSLVIFLIAGFVLAWDLAVETIKWRITRTATIRTRKNQEEVLSGSKGGKENVEGELLEEATRDPTQSLLTEKGPTDFGERPLDMSFLNDPGSVDQVELNPKYRLEEPLLDGTNEGRLLPRGNLAPYERTYSRFFASVLLPWVFFFHIVHTLTIIGFPLVRLCLWRYYLAFGGYAKSIKGRGNLERYSFAASRGLFLFPLSFFGLIVVVILFSLVVLPVWMALIVARGVVGIFCLDPSGVQLHLKSLRGSVLFVWGCIVWTFIPFLATLPLFGLESS